MKKSISFILILLLISGNYLSCRKEKGFPHVIPSLDLALIDFTHFVLPNQGIEKRFDTKVITNNNWPFVVERVSSWRTLTTVNLSVPIAAYKAVIGKTVSQISSDTWEWSYNPKIAGETYKVRLTGQTTGSKVKWEMYVSGSFPEFKWLEGTSNTDGKEGDWTFYENNASQIILKIEWRKLGDNIEHIKYSYENSYIQYTPTSGNFKHSCTVHYYNESLGRFSDVNFEWNPSIAGRVKGDDYLNGNWQCWNAQKNDENCN